MRLVIADTGPINYLVLIGNIDLLPLLFEKIILPSAVRAELTDQDAPPRCGTGLPILRLGLRYSKTPSRQSGQVSLEGLGDGETAAIPLAISLDADLLLMDDREA